MNTPLEICENRDPKGLYKKARRGEIRGFTGIDQSYEEPLDCELVIKSGEMSVDECVQNVISLLQQRVCWCPYVVENSVELSVVYQELQLVFLAR